MALTISLEPPTLTADDSHEESLFAPPARLIDLDLATGQQITSTDDPDQGIGERLRRLWHERGVDALTEQAIKEGKKDEDKADKAEDDDKRPTPQEMRELSSSLLEQLQLARQELTTALDLLSVISKPEEPPSVDPASLPLPQETLTLVPTAPPPPASTDPTENALASLPLALSLASIHKSASALFAAAEQLLPSDSPEASTSRSQPSNPWPTLLHLHSHSAHTLLPLGAAKGAALSGKDEGKSARQVGIFYGAEEAGLKFRRAAVARVSDLQEEQTKDKSTTFAGRKLVMRLEMDGVVGQAVWEAGEVGESGDDAVLSSLKERGRAAFAEELFEALSTETRNEPALKARLTLGKRSVGDSIELDGHNWSLSLTMVHNPPPTPAAQSSATATQLPSLLLPLLRLLFIQEYKNRRLAHVASQSSSPHSGPSWSRPILASLTVLLGYVQRGRRVREVLEEVASGAAGGESEFEFDGGGVESGVMGLLNGDRELGARAVLRVGRSPQRVFHVSYSLPLPHAPPGAFTSSSATVVPPPAAVQAPTTTLTLQAPGRGPIQIPSVEHLRLFLNEQVNG